MLFKIFLLVIYSIFVAGQQQHQGKSYPCGGDHGVLKIGWVHGTVVELQEGKQVKIKYEVDIKKQFPSEVDVEIEVKRKISTILGYHTVKCNGGFGSCTHRVSCGTTNISPCPLPTGTHLKREVSYTLPKIPFMMRFLGDGYWRLKVAVKDLKGNVLTCAFKYIQVST